MLDRIEYNNHIIEIHQDFDAMNPLTEWDHLGQMICWHRRYTLGHEHDFRNGDALFDHLKEQGPSIKLPLYLFDHGGISIATTPFSCPWDSGQVGWIYCTKQQARDWLGVKRLRPYHLDKINDILIAEVTLYDQYLKGEVYGYIAKTKCPTCQTPHAPIDSCWGFFDRDYMILEAKQAIDGLRVA